VLIVDLILLPLAYAGVVEAPSAIRGAGVLGGAALLLILAACALFGAWWRATRALWAGARRSPFFAGAVTACGLVAALGAYFLASVALGLSSALAA
jgi:amino acid permease